MNLGGSGGGIVWFVLALLSALASLSECYSYYEWIPKIQFLINGQHYATIQGDYVSYGSSTDLSAKLLVIDDPFFGCTAEANETDVPAYPMQSTFLLPDSSHCTVSEKSTFLYSTYRARAALLYRLSDANDEDDRQRRQTGRPRTSSQSSSSGPTVIRLNLLTVQLTQLLTQQSAGSEVQVRVEAQLMQRGFRTTQTFYFVVFAFCILMLLSCSWLLLSYFRRCHYRWRLRRNQARSANETRQMVNRLPTKSYKSCKEKGEVPTCVVCLEVFKNHESIRILPCKHEFHKKCIDPWLKMKRTCPMCKQDVFPSKRRRQSSSDATTSGSRSQRNNTARASSQDPTAILVTTAASSLRSLRRTRSWSDSSTSSGSSNSSNTASNTSATPLLGASSDSHSLGDSEVQLITVRPAVDSSVQEMEEGERDDSVVTVEVDESSSPQQQQQQEQSPREGEREGETGQNDHIGVDIEGPGLVHPAAPVVYA